MACVAFILAAGKSSRMGTARSKIELPLGGRPLLEYVLDVASHWAGDEVYCVLSPEQEQVSIRAHRVIQPVAKGTGDAFKIAFQHALQRDSDFLLKDILVVLGDAPLLQVQDLAPLMALPEGSFGIMGMVPPDPGAYGRIKIENGHVSIVEARHASQEESAIPLCNTGVMRMKASLVYPFLSELTASGASECYLTDLVARVPDVCVIEGAWQNFLGINTRSEWSQAEGLLQQRFRQKAMEEGALLLAPETTFLSYDTQVARDVMLFAHTVLQPGVRLERGVRVLPFSVLQSCHIQEESSIGPFAHIREGSVLGAHTCIGNFVEVKHSTLESGSKAKHLSYLGDAQIGSGVTIGAGVITCNYDGHKKSKVTIGSGSFVGSNAALVAPIVLGENVTVGAGSILTQDVPDQTLALSRADQKNIALSQDSKHLKRKNRSLGR
jgi:bifunctional UDP-N-acetylglucosamine pyrophosphorylase/glucosamine-1-phosphate N-acetyltransferase